MPLNKETKPNLLVLIKVVSSECYEHMPSHLLSQSESCHLNVFKISEREMGVCNILICRCMQKHIQHNKDERTQFFRKIYLSLYLKGFERVTKGIICER